MHYRSVVCCTASRIKNTLRVVMYALSLALLEQIVGLVYGQASLKTHVRFSLTKNWANLNAYYEWLTINVAPTQMSVGMA